MYTNKNIEQKSSLESLNYQFQAIFDNNEGIEICQVSY
jgi:hypothetical protein